MTNFIYNMQDELFHLNMILPVGEFSPIKKLVDHIEAQGKQLRELNAAITKRNATIDKYEHKNKDLRERNALLVKKVDELNEGIRNSEDLTWKQKYDALLHSSEQAIGALQKKCQEYKNEDTDATANTIETLVKKNKKLEERRDELKKMCEDIMVEKNAIIKELEEKNEKLKTEIASKEQIISTFDVTCNLLNKKVVELRKELDFWKTDDKRSFFGESFDMHSIYDLNRLEEVIVDKIKSYDSRLYSIMAERDKYKESSEKYRLKLMVAERQRDEHNKATETLSKIHSLIHGEEHL